MSAAFHAEPGGYVRNRQQALGLCKCFEMRFLERKTMATLTGFEPVFTA